MASAPWVFAYGSLIWRPDFAWQDRQPAVLRGWKRRFWQLSTDHRGTPSQPGRVVTLVPDAQAECVGVAFQLMGDVGAILTALDYREKDGYDRQELVIELQDQRQVTAIVYVAQAQNPRFAGPTPVPAIADQVRRSYGPSGSNAEYVLRLDQALTALGWEDPHVRAIANLVAA
ncbi:gamma-glutamylcyclotransferase [Synechococcus elongatus]|uniref:glutathione-specific gamma-glutamylcyclotransferase n=2 Tax=Synechococcus elongatus TaxID=32046 RepID=Q31P54_SYNE7|nr:gamma-glutamylcyclotransferase [Synechococcus elongatus]ABB57165.1 cation transporter [Synechococcus elongatus PCC 7942 = FACHB-805]AJD58321.1 gamma-glutamyl cyclotransferase [Synechococcus elongatus UTEX 2973]MBD2587569.1 gamma-glutamylcyclotransferase [Synechococcus elongatus FACHB-242]MBD2688652.1 gamma-glutamylcyclotransferase [Synechococcus elongatus FACHB-1061]MBD2707723.1 gamma-glutamylcyclotransferase [Synechococcus elongatus PCC 7942 = FACHB-805]